MRIEPGCGSDPARRAARLPSLGAAVDEEVAAEAARGSWISLARLWRRTPWAKRRARVGAVRRIESEMEEALEAMLAEMSRGEGQRAWPPSSSSSPLTPRGSQPWLASRAMSPAISWTSRRSAAALRTNDLAATPISESGSPRSSA